ncbi:hypothetical protein [Terrabacter sp. Root85]|uniref:hypothetical protein n=1 Tax=Terrabacter sp. Root85 TaxID=1736603 RepID=UPI000A8538B5|nr:hypothetical protein [Terrabacter sp. Root85]
MSAARNKGDDPLMRALGVAGIAWGSAILTAGSSIWRRLDGQAPTQGDQIALRFLGARHVATGTIQVLFPGRLQRLEIGIDVIHAATMVGVGALDPPRRRPALVTAAVALASAAAGMAIRERSSRDSPSSS